MEQLNWREIVKSAPMRVSPPALIPAKPPLPRKTPPRTTTALAREIPVPQSTVISHLVRELDYLCNDQATRNLFLPRQITPRRYSFTRTAFTSQNTVRFHLVRELDYPLQRSSPVKPFSTAPNHATPLQFYSHSFYFPKYSDILPCSRTRLICNGQTT